MIVARLLFFLVFSLACDGSSQNPTTKSAPDKMEDSYSDILKELEKLRRTVADLSLQVMNQQFYVEERVRTEGYSGVTLVRGGRQGLKNYDSATHVSYSAFGIHDHSNYDRTIGQGEFDAVLNGVHFRTRHNDYKLVMASTHSTEFHAVEDIPFPGVPPEVIKKSTVEEQITEMREWFRAFHNQDKAIRDYTKYFKPLLCYLEGAWTLDKDIQESFASDRHRLDASSWLQLHKRFRFSALSGAKSREENNAFLPTEISSVNLTTGELQFAQWNYRILCSPVKVDIPLSHLHHEEDLTYRVTNGQTISGTATTRAARFRLFDTSRKGGYQLLDEIFATIPGKNNHGGNLSFTVFGEEMYDTAYSDKKVLLNSAYYHRSYKTIEPSAGGIHNAEFGFNDDNMWAAQTSQPRVAPFEAEECTFVHTKDGKSVRQCEDGLLRVSYAIPLEIIFMTPLLSWNPYKLLLHNDAHSSTNGGRNGNNDTLALNGIDYGHYYMTPVEFFSGPQDKTDPADTVKDYLCVLDPDGKVRRVTASGTRVILPKIQEVGKMRLRYPVAPVHGEGSSAWKESNALKDKVLGSTGGEPSSVVFQLSSSHMNPPGEHTHKFTITYQDYSLLLTGQNINVTTDKVLGHTHRLSVEFVYQKKIFIYTTCDGADTCKDGHPPLLTLITKNAYTDV